MKIKFIKEYRAFLDFEGSFEASNSYDVGAIKNVTTKSAQWLIDNGFAEKVEEAKGGWKPEAGGTYYYVRDTMTMFMRGEVGRESWDDDDEDDEYRYSIGNVFKTIESAQRFIDYLKAVETVRHDNGVLTPEQLKALEECFDYIYFVGFNHTGDVAVCVLNLLESDILPGAIFFDTKKNAQASLDKHLDEWKTIANYDWSRG